MIWQGREAFLSRATASNLLSLLLRALNFLYVALKDKGSRYISAKICWEITEILLRIEKFVGLHICLFHTVPTRPCITVDWTCVPKAIRIKKAFLRMSQGNEITINILSESFERRRKTSGTESLNSWRNTWLVVTFSVFPFEIQSIDVKVSTPWGKRKMEEWDTHLLPFIKLQDAQIFVRQFHTRNESLCNIFSLAKVLFANLKA